MSLFKNHPVLAAIPITSLLFFSDVFAANIYVDNTLSGNCSGNYSVANRACNGSDGAAFNKIQAAINGAAVGDVVNMRGGTYKEISIDIPESLNGSAWTNGNFTTLRSQPGEWAIIDATGLTATGGLLDGVITHPNGFGTGEDSQYTEYWKFSNFEVTGGGAGISLKARHVKMYYLYIHDNGRAGVSELQSGVLSVNPQYLEIKYSWFKDNINAAKPNQNMAHIMFDADYKDNGANSGNGESWNINASTHHNEVAYNYFELTGANVGDPHIAIRQKNQQRFGFNDRSPNDMTNQEFGDDIHHNIVIGSAESIGVGQDFIQIHHNITDQSINIGRFGDVPTTYNAVVYNNTVISRNSASYVTSSGFTTSGTSDIKNFYDNGSQQTVHPHIYFFNNIASGNSNTYHDMPFLLHWDMPENSTDPDQDLSDLVLENNFIHDNSNAQDLIVGHNYNTGSFGSCDLQDKSISDFNFCSEIWRSVSEVVNWKNSTSGLFVGTAGADQFVTNATFNLDGSTTICHGGKGGNHPYLTGSIPQYVGATNPNNRSWVAGVFNDVTSATWLRDQVAGDPGWIEENGSQSTLCVFPKFPIPDETVI